MNTEQDSLTATLRGIASGSRRTKIARLREIFDEVEAAKAAGAGNKTIVDGLAAHGLIFDVNNFKNARSRILKERAMEELARVTPTTNENKSPCHPPKAGKTLTTNASVANATESAVEPLDELVRPAGISNAAWSEMRIKAAAEKRKKL